MRDDIRKFIGPVQSVHKEVFLLDDGGAYLSTEKFRHMSELRANAVKGVEQLLVGSVSKLVADNPRILPSLVFLGAAELAVKTLRPFDLYEAGWLAHTHIELAYVAGVITGFHNAREDRKK